MKFLKKRRNVRRERGKMRDQEKIKKDEKAESTREEKEKEMDWKEMIRSVQRKGKRRRKN